MQTSRALALGIPAALVIGCGALMGVLLHMLAVAMIDGVRKYDADFEDIDERFANIKNIEAGPIWTLGLVYVIPGLLALIAAFAQNKCLYITSCVISILALLLMGLVLVLAGLPLLLVLIVFYTLSKDCRDKHNVCSCRTNNYDSYEETPFKSCDYLLDFNHYGIGLGAVLIFAWIFLLAAFIISCIFATRSRGQPGTVYTPAQQPMLKGPEQPI